jgi:hypothetical protein
LFTIYLNTLCIPGYYVGQLRKSFWANKWYQEPNFSPPSLHSRAPLLHLERPDPGSGALSPTDPVVEFLPLNISHSDLAQVCADRAEARRIDSRPTRVDSGRELDSGAARLDPDGEEVPRRGGVRRRRG